MTHRSWTGTSGLAILAALSLSACGDAGGETSVRIANATSQASEERDAPYRDPALPAAERAADLVARMTVEEKASQMMDKAAAVPRLGVPAYVYWNEALHGIARAGDATVFPQAIGLAATFDDDLMLRVATAISDEGRAKHHDFERQDVRSIYTGLTYWSPNINIFRDPRWGRGQETYGEDPFLTGRMGTAFVRGLQGDDPEHLKSVATIKHFAVHSGPEKTRHSDDYRPPVRDLFETYLPAFDAVVRDAGVASAMCAYNAVYGEPACASEALLDGELRSEMGFDGFVVSDCGAVNDVWIADNHGFTETRAEAAAVTVKAGTDLECEDHNGKAYEALVEAVEEGLLEEADLDVAVTRLFEARFRLGLMDAEPTGPSADIPMSVVGSDEHLALSEEAARASLVLLKNDGILPLEDGATVALIGPNADNPDVLIGNYNGRPTAPSTPRDALSERLGDGLLYAPGGPLANGLYAHYETVPASVLSHEGDDGTAPGLVARYWAGATADGDPDAAEVLDLVDETWDENPATDRYDGPVTMVFEGLLTPDAPGRYRFDDQMAVEIDGQAVSEDGAQLEAGRSYEIRAARTVEPAWHSNAIAPTAELAWIDLDRDLMAEAMTAAEDADVIIFASGLSARLEGEEMDVAIPGFDGGDRTTLDLPTEQAAMLEALAGTGKPIVHVNFTGSAVNLAWSDENAAAVVQGFYPGERTGPALAGLLFGEYDPSGRLPVTFYETVDGLPPFADYSMENRTYKYYTGTPVYPFGHGLGFAEIAYGEVQMPSRHDPSGVMTVSAVLTNDTDGPASEVVQLYALGDGETAPLRRLVAFDRVAVPPNGDARVELSVPATELTTVTADGIVEPLSGEVDYALTGGDGRAVTRTVAMASE